MAASSASYAGSSRLRSGYVGAGPWRWAGVPAHWLTQRLDEERGRWFLWLPVFYAAGIALYLGARSEPPLLLCIGALLTAALLRHFLRLTVLSLAASTILLMLALGALTGKLRALTVSAPILTQAVTGATLTGWIEAAERHKKAYRVTLRLKNWEARTQGVMPRRVRLRYHGKSPLPEVGTLIQVKASLRPPPEPVQPGGFDFARHQWFEGLGAGGFAYGKVELLDAGPAPLDLRTARFVSNLRQGIAARVANVLAGENAAIAQALIMGERGGISEQTQKALTDSGLAHVVSISGFHMALTAGSAFWLLRAVMAAFPGLALAFPIKIWAALAALGVATFYLMISGSDVTAVRSYIMIAIMFAAIILNRPAVSLRNLAIAALLILAASPESLIDPGFQMSFAATAALIAVYEDGPATLTPPATWPMALAIPLRMAAAAVISSIAAGLAVDPIAAYHFHRIAVYSALGNLVAMPAISVIVMPMALIALIAMPFGLEAVPLRVMDWGIGVMLKVANFVASLPGAVISVPAFSLSALLAMAAGGLWFVLWRGRWRYFGLMPVAAGLAAAPFAERPDVFVDREGYLIAVRMKDGQLFAPKTRKAEFSMRAWLEADGDARPPREVMKGSGFQCDEQSCLALLRGKILSHVTHPAALADDCRRAAVVVSPLPVAQPCPHPAAVIDARALWEKGAHALYIEPGGIRVETVAESRGRRPWVTVRSRRELIAPAPAEPGGAGKPEAEASDLPLPELDETK